MAPKLLTRFLIFCLEAIYLCLKFYSELSQIGNILLIGGGVGLGGSVTQEDLAFFSAQKIPVYLIFLKTMGFNLK